MVSTNGLHGQDKLVKSTHAALLSFTPYTPFEVPYTPFKELGSFWSLQGLTAWLKHPTAKAFSGSEPLWFADSAGAS